MNTHTTGISGQELYTLYCLGKESTLENLWKSGERTSVLASMLSSWDLRKANAQGASEYLPFIENAEERALKYQTIRLMPKLIAPLEQEPRVHLILLVYNRIQYVETALRQLAATNYNNYAVYILDNGSTDGSAAISARAREYFPAHVEVHSLVMPFNIGRPLGHNWLLTHFDHSAAEYIAIGDDDLVVVPPDWMQNMLCTFRCFPNMALVGGKALDPYPGKVLNIGAMRLINFTDTAINFRDNYNQPDIGQQDYVDLTDHVIGCLNMYKKDVFFGEVGLFDIRYSPCQYVDIDHHIRIRLAGMSIA